MADPTKLITTNFSSVKMPDTGSNNGNQTKTKKDTQFWLNVGLERANRLISLPMGIPLDELVARPIPNAKTQNQDFRNQRLAEHQLWEEMKKIMSTLKPGEEVELPFTVRLRRIDEKEQVESIDQTENPFAIGAFEVKKTA